VSRAERVAPPTAVVTPGRDYGESSRGRCRIPRLVAKPKPCPWTKSPQPPFTKGGQQMGLSYIQHVIFPLWQRGTEGDFAARSSSRKSEQHIYSTSKA